MRGILSVLLALSACLSACSRNSDDQPKVLLDAVLMDGTGRPPVPGSIVVVRNGVIAALGEQASIPAPTDGVIFRVPGKFIFPSDPSMPLRAGGPANLLIVNVNPATDPEYAKKTSGRMLEGHWSQYPQ